MGKLLGLFLVAAGFGLAMEMLPQGIYERSYSYVSRAVSPAVPTSNRHAQTGRGTATVEAKQRTFASSHPLTASEVANSASSQVVTGSIRTEVSQTSAATDTVQLARLLQAELRRVGCYSGDVDGDWGPASRRAMTAFAKRVNSTLPIETPDLVLLSLVRGHNRRICAADCDDGQIMSSRGHCVQAPAVIEASSKPAIGGWEPVITAGALTPKPVTRTASRQDVTNPNKGQLAAAIAMPTTVTASVNTSAPTRPASQLPRTIDWTTRMSVGVVATPAAAAVLPQSAPVVPQQPGGAALEQPVTAAPQSAAETAPLARAAPKPSEARSRKAKRAKATIVERAPPPVYRPRSASNWRSTAFTTRN